MPAPAPMPPPVAPAGPRRLTALSFALLVLAPLGAAALYLFWFAAPQFQSHAGFTVRYEQPQRAPDPLGGLVGARGGATSDADILYAYLTSQALVRKVDQDLDLRTIFGRPGARDPVFGFAEGGTIEDLTRYWGRMVQVSHDTATGLIELRARAFTAGYPLHLARAALRHGAEMINNLSARAREDLLGHAQYDVEEAWQRLTDARRAITLFRSQAQIVDPSADVSGQMGLLSSLEGDLAHELIRLDVLIQNTTPDHPRIAASRQRIAVMEARIAEERRKLGGAQGDADYATVLDQYERLNADLAFASDAYTAARTALEEARAEARRQSRYLAPHIQPTLAERATAPDPLVILGLSGLFLTLIWGTGALSVASLRDRA